MSSFQIPLYKFSNFEKIHRDYIVHFDVNLGFGKNPTSYSVVRDSIKVTKLDGSGFLKFNPTTGKIKLSLTGANRGVYYNAGKSTDKFYIASMISRALLSTLKDLNIAFVKGTDLFQAAVNDNQSKGVVQVKKGQYVVGSVIDGILKLSSCPKIHASEVEAKLEAARLASSIPGKEFVVLSVVGVVKATGVVWS